MSAKKLWTTTTFMKRATRERSWVSDPLRQCLAPMFFRGMATETYLPEDSSSGPNIEISTNLFLPRSATQIVTTMYSFPDMSPLAFHPYSANHLQMPLRRDILHRAVIYEGDNTRQGTASTKWRSEVHGSNAKIRPQKGTGRARLGDKKSPMLRGGGVAFGPKPRDHSTDLPRKIYDMAWRTALSYRFNKGELVVVDQLILDHEQPGYLEQILARNHWGNADGRSLMVAISEKDGRENLFAAMGKLGQHGNALSQDDVDVKDLLEMGRVIIEKAALDRILQNHSSDLDARVPSAVKS